jgi:DNA repair exonuclease SbcCD ATPase subunit
MLKKPNSKDGKLSGIKQQQQVWLQGLRQSRESVGETVKDVALDNWCKLSSNQMGLCRVCVSQMKKPMLLIPCGHSFCEGCLENQCPQCFSPIQHKVRNLALEEMLKNSIDSTATDFDQDPEMMAQKYKHQLDQLNSRIELLEGERNLIDKEYKEKTSQIQSVTRILEESTNEMKSIASQIEQLEKRLFQLNSICAMNEPLVEKLESEISTLSGKSEMVHQTLDSLIQRRDKVSVIWNGLFHSLNK